MSALTALITGVAHEINTPLGVAVTANSGLDGEVNALIELVAAGKANRKAFDDFSVRTEDYMQMLRENLSRVVVLVDTFRSLTAYENDTILESVQLADEFDQFSKKHLKTIKKAGHTLELHCPPELTLTTYSRSLQQSLTYLLENSLQHAFEEGQQGHIALLAEAHDDTIEITYQDDGCGIVDELRAHLFDPFVTSKRHTGSIGLGGHILYILVTQKLGGYITIDDQPSTGLKVRIRLPIQQSSIT